MLRRAFALRAVGALAMILAAGCGPSLEATEPSAADDRAPPAAPGSAAESIETTAPPESAPSAEEKKATRSPPCPVVPMTLTMGLGGRRLAAFLSLDERGDVRTMLSGGLGPDDRVIARLDPRGCLAGDDGVWVERTRTGTHWTLRGRFDVQGTRLMFPRPLELQSNGDVLTVAEPVEGSMPVAHFDGYRPQGECAALLLLTTWLSMMPSMAVVDGNPIELPPPDPSVCPDLHQR